MLWLVKTVIKTFVNGTAGDGEELLRVVHFQIQVADTQEARPLQVAGQIPVPVEGAAVQIGQRGAVREGGDPAPQCGTGAEDYQGAAGFSGRPHCRTQAGGGWEAPGQEKELNRRALGALKRNNKAKAKKLLKELRDGLQEHEEDLLIADTSPNGWLAVAKVRGRSDIPEDLRKKLEKVDRELWRHRSYGKPAKKFGGFQEEGGGGDVRTRRPQQKLSPEEILHNAARQTRAGTCSHCRGENHFYRECPDFWKKVREAREERAKGQPLAN